MDDQRVRSEAGAGESAERTSQRRHQRSVLQVLSGVIAVLAFTTAAGLTMPVVPADGPAFSAPDRITVTTAAGTEVELERFQGATTRFGSYARNGRTFTLLDVDTRSRVVDRVPIVEPADIIGSDELPVRFVARVSAPHGEEDPSAGEVRLRDEWRMYVPVEDGLPEYTDQQINRGEVGADGGSVTTDDRSILAIAPSYRDGSTSPQQWVVLFDFAALHAAGNTNLGFPLPWYIDGPVVPAIRAVAPVLGVVFLGLALFLPRLHWRGSSPRTG
ncbi:hypothetical protein [Plantibacter sp. LMC-P-059a]|uniref:hypothetical protein n=1 Tax=Plantibacter sp. LMC-P-059a TaxID=3040297 RepID=UPI00254D8689|nr:hypothetical protein [Plantibacter sp. LMC-P-059a]